MRQQRSISAMMFAPLKSHRRSLTRLRMRWRTMKFRQKLTVTACGIFLILSLVYYMISVGDEIILPSGTNVDDYAPFEPAVTVDFPQGDPDQPKIPRIIHQTFPHTSIPPGFHGYIGSLMKHNPGWQYYLWTDEASRQFIADTHPELLETYDGYTKMAFLRKADFIRYVALYEFGGVYADMDTITHRPLDVAITRYTCIMPTEPFEHSSLRTSVPFLMNNAIMLCRAKHPFLKLILERLPQFAHMDSTLDSTGPAFVTAVFMEYNNLTVEANEQMAFPREANALQPFPKEGLQRVSSRGESKRYTSNSPYFYHGKYADDDERAVYVPNTEYFCNKVDPVGIFTTFSRMCKDFSGLNMLRRRGCVNLKRRGLWREGSKYTIISHEFYRTYAGWHFYNYVELYLFLFSKDIRQLVPQVTLYSTSKGKIISL